MSRVAVLVDESVPGLEPKWPRAVSRWAADADLELVAARACPPSELAGGIRELTDRVSCIVLSNAGADESGLAEAIAACEARVIHVDLGLRTADDVRRACDRRIQGRGFAGMWSALHHAASWERWTPEVISYGEHEVQVGELRVPGGPGAAPVAVLVHGGFWRPEWERDTTDRIAVALAEDGWATWNVEYRRLRGTDGGWPETFDDVAASIAALDALASGRPLDPSRVVLIGHSVGATLVLAAAAGRRGLRPSAVVSLSGLVDVRHAVRTRIGDGDVLEMFGTPEEDPGRYERAAPMELLPLGVPLVVTHGDQDEVVPAATARSFAALAVAAGDEVVEVFGAGAHFDPLDPTHELWQRTSDHLPR